MQPSRHASRQASALWGVLTCLTVFFVLMPQPLAGEDTLPQRPRVVLRPFFVDEPLFGRLSRDFANVLQRDSEFPFDVTVNDHPFTLEQLATTRESRGRLQMAIVPTGSQHQYLLDSDTSTYNDSSHALRVLMPLYELPVLFITRRQGRIREFQQISNQRISFGPPKQAQAYFAETVYRLLFYRMRAKVAIFPSHTNDLNQVNPLQSLLDGSVDIVCLMSPTFHELSKYSPEFCRENFYLIGFDPTSRLSRIMRENMEFVRITRDKMPWIDKDVWVPAFKMMLIAPNYLNADNRRLVMPFLHAATNAVVKARSARALPLWMQPGIEADLNCADWEFFPGARDILIRAGNGFFTPTGTHNLYFRTFRTPQGESDNESLREAIDAATQPSRSGYDGGEFGDGVGNGSEGGDD